MVAILVSKLPKPSLKAGIETKIVDIADRILNTYLDQEFTEILQQNSEKHGLYFKGGETVQSLTGDDNGNVTKVVTDKMNMKQILFYSQSVLHLQLNG